VFVVFGRPKGDRGSYKQWEEADLAPQVVFEVLSPGNTTQEMEKKDAFYNDHGVEEYYIYDPEKDYLNVYLRKGTVLRRWWVQNDFVSPRLGIRFDLTGPEMQIFYPDGRRFLTFVEQEAERAKQWKLRIAAEEKLQAAEKKLQNAQETLLTAQETLQITQETQQATQETQQATEKKYRRMAELSRKARRGETTPEELAELQRLENEVG